MCINILWVYALLAHSNDTHIIASLSLCRSSVWKIWNSNVYTFYAITECLFLFTIYALNFCCCFFLLSNRFHFRKLHQTVLIGVLCEFYACRLLFAVCFSEWIRFLKSVKSRGFRLENRFRIGFDKNKQTISICMHGQVAFYLTFKKEKERKIEKSKNVLKKKHSNVNSFYKKQLTEMMIYNVSTCVHYVWTEILALLLYLCMCACVLVCVNGIN